MSSVGTENSKQQNWLKETKCVNDVFQDHARSYLNINLICESLSLKNNLKT